MNVDPSSVAGYGRHVPLTSRRPDRTKPLAHSPTPLTLVLAQCQVAHRPRYPRWRRFSCRRAWPVRRTAQACPSVHLSALLSRGYGSCQLASQFTTPRPRPHCTTVIAPSHTPIPTPAHAQASAGIVKPMSTLAPFAFTMPPASTQSLAAFKRLELLVPSRQQQQLQPQLPGRLARYVGAMTPVAAGVFFVW